MMRVLLAAIFVFAAMLGAVALMERYLPKGPVPWWAKALPATALLVALFLSMFIFNKAGFRPFLRRKSLPERIAELEAKGQLLRQSFEATQAFGVSEFEDEGPHYYIELADGQVLYLNGQYLYDYEPIEDDPELNQPRSFPCTQFEVLRHKIAGYAIHINCGGRVLEPQVMAPPFSRAVVRSGIPEDGEVLQEEYEGLKQRYTSA
jgi:hypothetical protein